MKTLKPILLIAFLLLFCAEVFSYDFPADTVKPLTMFGQAISPKSTEDSIPVCETGMSFTDVELVKVSEIGTLILSMEKTNKLGSFPSVLGNAIITQTENGFQVIYGNLEETASLAEKNILFRFDGIGRLASQKNGKQKPLLFKIFDTTEKNKNFVNPLLFLPEVADSKRPELKNVYLKSETGQMIAVTNKMSVKSGKYTLCLETSDAITGSDIALSPFEFTANLNGKTAATTIMQTIYAQGGKMQVSEDFSVVQLYNTVPYFSLCTLQLTEGLNRLTISVRDYSKNKTEALYEITVF